MKEILKKVAYLPDFELKQGCRGFGGNLKILKNFFIINEDCKISKPFKVALPVIGGILEVKAGKCYKLSNNFQLQLLNFA